MALVTPGGCVERSGAVAGSEHRWGREPAGVTDLTEDSGGDDGADPDDRCQRGASGLDEGPELETDLAEFAVDFLEAGDALTAQVSSDAAIGTEQLADAKERSVAVERPSDGALVAGVGDGEVGVEPLQIRVRRDPPSRVRQLSVETVQFGDELNGLAVPLDRRAILRLNAGPRGVGRRSRHRAHYCRAAWRW
jgi:hypothetical protein